MAQKDNVVAATRDLVHAVDDLRAALTAPDPEPVHLGARKHLRRFPALAIALALCRDVEAGTALVERFKRVPDEYVKDGTVTCRCGASHSFGDLVPCPGACGRWFAGDASGVWAARLNAGPSDA